MPFIQITHKKQTRANDCWYACIQMLKTHRAGGTKTKPTGQAVHHHRNHGLTGRVLGNAIGSGDGDFQGVLNQNGLQDLNLANGVGTATRQGVQATCDQYGPFMIGGEFGQAMRIRGTSHWMFKRMGHYIVVVGTDPMADTVIVHDPWRSHRTEMSFQRFRQLMWRGAERTIVGLA